LAKEQGNEEIIKLLNNPKKAKEVSLIVLLELKP